MFMNLVILSKYLFILFELFLVIQTEVLYFRFRKRSTQKEVIPRTRGIGISDTQRRLYPVDIYIKLIFKRQWFFSTY